MVRLCFASTISLEFLDSVSSVTTSWLYHPANSSVPPSDMSLLV